MRFAVVCLILLLVVSPGVWAEDARELFTELARGTDATDAAAVEGAHLLLAAQDPDYLATPLPATRLRTALARRLPPEAVRSLLAARLEGGDLDGALSIVSNLQGRPDLASLVAATPGWKAMLGHEEGEKVQAEGADVLRPVARAGLRTGDRDLAIALLQDARTTVRMADTLSESHDAHGLQLLADAVTGTVPLPPLARAELATCEPDIWNIYGVRTLTAEQAAALVNTAEEDEDPHMRAVAARVLLRSARIGGSRETIRAYLASPSWLVDDGEWSEIARMWWIEPLPDLALPDVVWEHLLRNTVYRSHVRAHQAPQDAEVMAGLLLRHAQSPMDARRRGLFLRLLEQLDYAFIDDAEGPWSAVPTRRKILENVRDGRPDDPPELVALARRIHARLAKATLGEQARRLQRGAAAEAGEHAPEVWPRLPAAYAKDAPVDADEVQRWLQLDPRHLFDPDVASVVRSWSPDLRARILDLYPREVVRGWLEKPPVRTRVPGRATFVRDPQRRAGRAALVGLFADSPVHRELLVSTLPVGSWPVASRFTLGGHLHRILPRVGMEAVRLRLADDAVAAGFAVAAIASPHGLEDLSFAADLLTSPDRPDALALVADAEEYGPSERLGADEDWPSAHVPVHAERRAALARVVRDAPDPWRALLAARVLAIGATPDDLAILLSPAGERLDAGTSRASHILTDLASHVGSPAHLEVVLTFLADRRVSSRARVEIFDHLTHEDFFRWDMDPEDRAPGADEMRDRLLAWIASEAGKVDLETSEGLIHVLAKRRPEEGGLRILEALKKAVGAWSAEGPRLRALGEIESAAEDLEDS